MAEELIRSLGFGKLKDYPPDGLWQEGGINFCWLKSLRFGLTRCALATSFTHPDQWPVLQAQCPVPGMCSDPFCFSHTVPLAQNAFLYYSSHDFSLASRFSFKSHHPTLYPIPEFLSIFLNRIFTTCVLLKILSFLVFPPTPARM